MQSAEKERALVYKVLSLSFFHPTSEVGQVWNAINKLLGDSSEHKGSNTAPDWRELEFEYNRLFVGPEHVQCPPYESVYRSDRPDVELGLVMGPSVTDVKRMYGEAGLGMSKELKELPDHIAIELEFMSSLCLKEAESNDQREADLWRARQSEFWRSHLKPWAATFGEMTSLNALSQFYRLSGRLLQQFMEEEADYLGV